ncbi:MAG: hypothetical protein V4651_08465 [Bacteroidota bacterium]
MLIGICSIEAISKEDKNPKDTVIIQTGTKTYIPFTFLQKPVLQVVNERLNISITDRTGDMIQLNGIDIASLRKGILSPKEYRIIYISQKRGTATDDHDTNLNSLLEITRCESNKPGSSITLGLKSTVSNAGKNYRIYATISGIIPTYSYNTTNLTK